MRISIADAVRYMGAGEGDTELRRKTGEIAAELEAKVTPRYTWRAFRTVWRADGFFLPEAGETLAGRLAEEKGVTNTAIALAWILRYPAKMQAVIGTTKPSRIEDAAKACDITLSRKEWYEIYTAAGHILP